MNIIRKELIFDWIRFTKAELISWLVKNVNTFFFVFIYLLSSDIEKIVIYFNPLGCISYPVLWALYVRSLLCWNREFGERFGLVRLG